jgi:plasmid stability protein
MSLMIDLPPEIERWLEQEAARHGQSAGDHTRVLLQEIVTAAMHRSERPLPGGVRRRSTAELLALAREQGVKPVQRFEDLLGDEPDLEGEEAFDVDAFLEARRQWQHEGGPGGQK